MSKRNSRRRMPGAIASAVALVACLALPSLALAKVVTVRVEGQSGTLVEARSVVIGNGLGTAESANGIPLPPAIKCANDTAYQAIENATEGEWDRSEYTHEIKGEEHSWEPNEEYWIFYYDNNYADWGICQQHLEEGDTVLMQAGVSGTEGNGFIPDSVPLELEVTSPASGPVEIGHQMTVHVTAWEPTDIFGEEDPEFPGEHWILPPSEAVPAIGYTVTAGGASGVTNGSGNATLTMIEAGPVAVQASMPGSGTNWGRSVPATVCVDDGNPGTCP